jgi:hypothetical protein
MFGQMNMYNSTSMGFDRNAQFNYMKSGDQIKTNYLELNYILDTETTLTSISYISGLQLYNNFYTRNYYEHSLTAGYQWKFLSEKKEEHEQEIQDSIETLNEEADEAEDSTDSYLDIFTKGGIRHDKSEFKEFDNSRVAMVASFRFPVYNNINLRITNSIEYRRYTYLPELSNVLENIIFQFGNDFGDTFNYSISAAFGSKMFIVPFSDTTLFESLLPGDITMLIKKIPTGSGKEERIDTSFILSSRKLNEKTSADNLASLVITVENKWNPVTFFCSAGYRVKISDGARFLGHYANTQILTEDIYNDAFDSEGAIFDLRFTFPLIWGIKTIINPTVVTKNYNNAALNLEGQIINIQRKDITSSVDFILSRQFILSGSLTADLYINYTLNRNQSNDEYNNYSGYSVLTGIAVGF